MSEKVYDKVNFPGNRSKMNQKLHDWTFDQYLLLLCNDETDKNGLRHTRHLHVLITVLAVQ